MCCAHLVRARSPPRRADLLSKDYKVGKTTVEVKSKTPSGVTFTPTATKSGDSVSGTLKAAYKLMPWLDGEATFGTNGSLDMSVEAADALTKPLPAPAVRRFQLAMSGAVPLPLPDLDGPPGRLGLSVTRPDLFPRLSDV